MTATTTTAEAPAARRRREYMALPLARCAVEIMPLSDAEAGARFKQLIRDAVEKRAGVIVRVDGPRRVRAGA